MKPIFKQLRFKKRVTTTKFTQDATVEFFIPGVNSGMYEATLHMNVLIDEMHCGFFKLKPYCTTMNMTLSREQFDELFLEMQKIKAIRDGLDDVKKQNIKL